MPPIDVPSPAYGLPLLYAVHPVVTATEVAREHGAELAIGARATEQAAHAAVRRSQQLAQDDHPGQVPVDPARLRAMADELEAVRRVLIRTEATRSPAPEPDRDPVTAPAAERRGASAVATVWVSFGSLGLLIGSGAYLLGAPPLLAAAPFAVALVIASVCTVLLRRAHQPGAAAPEAGVGAGDRAPRGPTDQDLAAVRAARAVVDAHEERWEETWAELGHRAPDPVALEDAVADLQFGNLVARTRSTVVDLRDRPKPLVAVEPFRGIGPHRAQALRELLDQLPSGLLVAIVVGTDD